MPDQKEVTPPPLSSVAKTPPDPKTSTSPAPKPRSHRTWLIISIVVIVGYILFNGVAFIGGGFWHNPSYAIPIPSSSSASSSVSSQPSAPVSSSTQASGSGKQSSKKSSSVAASSASSSSQTEQSSAPAESGPQTTFTKQEEIDYFVKIAITDEAHNFLEIPLSKWTKNNVTVRYFGPGSAADVACADETIATFNSLSQTTKLAKTDGGLYDIEVHFATRAEIEARGLGDALGYMHPTTFANGAFAHAEAYAPYDYGDDHFRCHIIRHEMTHTIGLQYNLTVLQGGFHYSIFNVGIEGWSDYINIDKDLIKMMYNTGVQPGWGAAQARDHFANISW